MKTINLLLSAVLCMFVISSCSHKLDEIRVVPQGHKYSMLIAGDSSEFKDSVRDKIIEKYRGECAIHVVNINALSKEDAQSYDVVLIMDTCMAWSGFNPALKSFLNHDENLGKTVLSMTAGDPDWQYSYKGVDAITSASVIDNQDRFFSRIDDQIQRILNARTL